MPRPAGLHHGVGLLQTGRHRLLAVDGLDPGDGAIDDHLRVGFHRQDGSGDIEVLLHQQLAVVAIALYRKAVQKDLQVGVVWLGGGGDFGARIALVAPGVSMSFAPAADDTDAVGLVSCHGLAPLAFMVGGTEFDRLSNRRICTLHSTGCQAKRNENRTASRMIARPFKPLISPPDFQRTACVLNLHPNATGSGS